MLKLQKKSMIMLMTMVSLTGSVFAAGVNNTVDPAAAAQGAESYGKENTILSTATSAFAAGFKNTVKGANGFAVGTNNSAEGTNSFVGGEGAKAKGRNSLAFGATAEAITDNTFAIGSQARTNGTNTIAIGNGAYAQAEGAVAQGSSTMVDIKDGVAIGSNSKATTAAVATTAINSDTSNGIDFTNHNFAGSTPNSIVSFGNANFTRQLQNVAAGRVSSTSTDAINGSQLHDVALEAQKHTTIESGNNNITVTEGENDNHSKKYTIGLSSDFINQINNLSGGTSSLRNIIDANQKEAHKGIAGSAALASLHPLDFDPDHKLDVMAGYGHYHNANAVAIGVAYRPTEDLMITVGSTVNGDDDTVFNAGISYKVGAKSTVSRSRMAMARDLADAKRQIAELQADNEKIKSILNSVLGLDDTQLSKVNH